MTIGATSPAARAHQALVDAETAAEAEGIYTPQNAAIALRKGELTYEQVLAIAKDGKIRQRAKRYAKDTQDPDEIDADEYGDSFTALTFGANPTLTDAQATELNGAVSGYYGDDDERNTWPESTRVPVEDPDLPPPGEVEPRIRSDGDPADYRYYTVGEPPTAVLRVKGPFVESYQPESEQWIAADFFFDSVFGDDAHESTEVAQEAAEALVESGEGLREIPPESLAKLAAAS